MPRARWTALVAVAALAASVGGVAGCGSSVKHVQVRKLAFVAPFKDNEPDWTLQAREVLDEFPQRLGVRVDTVDASQTSDIRGALVQVSHEGNQLVMADNGTYADAAEAVAADTKVPELVWGERPTNKATQGLVGAITVKDKESGYALGVLAATSAITRRLGIVVGADGSDWELATWNRMAGGFVAGAHSVHREEHVEYVQVGSHGAATVRAMHDAAERELQHGAQMIVILGGASMVGAQRAVEARGGSGETLYLGAVSDKGSTRHLEEGGVPFIVGAVVWNLRPVFRQALVDLRAGTFGKRPSVLSFANGGLAVYTTGRAPSDAAEAAIAAGRPVARGAVHLPVTPTREAVEALVRERAAG